MKVTVLFAHFSSPAIRDHLWSCDDHHPADDQRYGQVPRHAQQRQGVHEATRGWSTINLCISINLSIYLSVQM